MPKIRYQSINFRGKSKEMIDTCNTIIANFSQQGFDLTLRQLYYQLVKANIIANKQTEYKRLGSVVNDARLAGLIDWDAIVDRTRTLRGNSHWSSPSSIIDSAWQSYGEDKWMNQVHYPEVWIEKDALVGVIEPVCRELDIKYFSCRGYTSQSEMWEAGQRLNRRIRMGQTPYIIHLGDHDPSGKDMTRDIEDRLALFCGRFINIHRISLNYDQIEELDLPPNPCKLTDSRSENYVAEFGEDSWELDALDPSHIAQLIEETVWGIRDDDAWDEAMAKENENREALKKISRHWEAVKTYSEGL